ncbi:hypothetical protein ACFQLX_01195 [Streptomyces polyrhachis]|uniref:Uncharacterized protein n=1 Tax=Streptomyces polyrhachis TaxID=1282885 RepID=A0ABW2GC02_9ACTN
MSDRKTRTSPVESPQDPQDPPCPQHPQSPRRPVRGAGPSPRRRLRREVPATVALLTEPADFAEMRGYASFGFDDHQAYLAHAAALLRSFAGRGVHVTVARFDPEEFQDFCRRRGLDPDGPQARTRYTAELAPLRATVPYEGQAMPRLLADLRHVDGRMRVWEQATRELAAAGSCGDCGEDLAKAAFDRAVAVFAHLIGALGPGAQHLVCSIEDGVLSAAVRAEPEPGGGHTFADTDALDFCTVLALAFARDSAGGVVVRSTGSAGAHGGAPGGRGEREARPAGGKPEVVRGWRIAHGWLLPLTAAEVFSAYCEDAVTGEPIPPEPDVDYRAGTALPPPEPGCPSGP